MTVEALANWRATHVVVDSYLLDASWHRRVRQALSVEVVAIDDLGDRDLDADLLVDPNVCRNPREKYRNRIGEGTRILAGPRFALLAPEYACAARYAPVAKVRSVGICMGGSDAAGLSTAALVGVRQCAYFSGPIEIATTSANPHLEALRDLCTRWPHTTLTVDQLDLSTFFVRHDVHIGAGGGAAWERCCLGAPAVVLLAADNQRVVITELARLGVVATPDPMEALDPSSIGEAVAGLIENESRRLQMSEAGQNLVDGRGAQRVALAIAAPMMAVRRAGLADAALMHEWRNSPATRAMSLDSREITFEEHERWLARSVQSRERVLLVACIGTVPVGVIRFDLEPDRTAMVSLYLDPALHGLSLGGRMLTAGELYVLDQEPDLAGFVATVVETNTVSQRLFRTAGYFYAEGRWFKRCLPKQAEEGDS